MKEFELSDKEQYLLIMSRNRASMMTAVIVSAIWTRHHEDEEFTSRVQADFTSLRRSLQALREVEDSAFSTNGIDLAKTMMQAAELPAEVERFFRSAGYPASINLRFRTLDNLTDELVDGMTNLKHRTGIILTAVGAEEGA